MPLKFAGEFHWLHTGPVRLKFNSDTAKFGENFLVGFKGVRISSTKHN